MKPTFARACLLCISMLLASSASAASSAQSVCLAAAADVCLVIASRVGFQIAEAGESGETTQLIFATPIAPSSHAERFPNGLYHESTLIVREDLAKRVKAGEMHAEDAQLIDVELFSHQDDTYRIPSTESELKTALGFLPDARVSPSDLVENLNVHLQLSLNVTPLTATYLARLLGARAVASDPMAASESNEASFERSTQASEARESSKDLESLVIDALPPIEFASPSPIGAVERGESIEPDPFPITPSRN